MASGLPAESGLSMAILGVTMGRRLGLDDARLADVYYAALTRFLGSTATSNEFAVLAMGEDQAVCRTLTMADSLDAESVARVADSIIAPDAPTDRRRAALRNLRGAHASLPTLDSFRRRQAIALASRLPVPPGVPAILEYMHARWDGRDGGATGEAIPIEARILTAAVVAESFRRAGGIGAVNEVLAARAGNQLDPELCRLIQKDAKAVFHSFRMPGQLDRFLDAEPGSHRIVHEEALDDTARVFGAFADNKSPFHIGHSRHVSLLASFAAEATGLNAEQCAALRRAALLHDIGRTAIRNGIWEKPGTLNLMERLPVQSHTSHTEVIVALSGAFTPLAELASRAHERADGSGYHRRIRITDAAAHLLAAADVYDALVHDRPWRLAHGPRAASHLLLGEAAAGRLSQSATHAVLEVAGRPRDLARRTNAAGLTPREVEVARLLARGISAKRLVTLLGISLKTADHHVEHVYGKTAVRGRAAVALFALENDLLTD
jgi:HD-GYP domain-containing protein (c-di-GMP phosphodiesterase class II)